MFFKWLSFIFQPHFYQKFVEQLAYYTEDKPANSVGKLFLSIWFFLSFLIFKPSNKSNIDTYKWLKVYFPQINFARLSILDPIRFLIQSVWLLLVPQQPIQGQKKRFHQFKQMMLSILHALFYLPTKIVALWTKWLERKAEKIAQNHVQNKSLKNDLLSLGNVSLFIVILVLSILCFTVPFTLEAQAIFLLVLWVIAMLFRRVLGHFATVLMIALSVIISCRYLWWRATSTLNWDEPLGLILGIILLVAEVYSWIVLMLGYFQNIWPLHRQPIFLPEETKQWPTIDLFIPTYNEDLSVVQETIYAALGIDWPKDKLNIYVLDDGKRDSFKNFAQQVGVGYICRPTNEHAKAGNINYALKRTHGEFVAIFDCDHIPTRGFFQMTMGWFLKDPTLALIQTPHHFFSPDPFERNLSNFRDVPSEGNLFYGLIQDGNDLWGATFFCGSCAIIRRIPLEEVGGIAVETVTEDAHTSLRMHRLGYRSAYLRKPLSAGLATETLSAHIGQRIRWARGMAQIFRLDNPLLGKGLKWPQRLCYVNAMLHFLSGIPRIIYLLAPLAFLILHSYVIYAPAIAIVLYVLPHMVHASITNSRLQGDYRYSFWGEVYETVLSWYIARPTTVALLFPNKGTFNVTAKGGLINESHYDWGISKPYLVLVFLNIIGLAWGFSRLYSGPTDEILSVLVNMFWVIYNLFILGAAVAVAKESKQIRSSHRVVVDIPISMELPSEHVIHCEMKDFSSGGIQVEMPEIVSLSYGYQVNVVLKRGSQSYAFPMKVVYSKGKSLGLQLMNLTTQQRIDYVQCTFARADTWTQWQNTYKTDKPLSSMFQVLNIGIEGYGRILQSSPKLIRFLGWIIYNLWTLVMSLKPYSVKLKSD